MVAPELVVGDEPGVHLALELTDGGEVPAVERRAPALVEDRLVNRSQTALRLGEWAGIRSWRRALVAKATLKARAWHSGPLSMSTALTEIPWRR